jgi:D-alanyl-D-alanine carboxypeptidase
MLSCLVLASFMYGAMSPSDTVSAYLGGEEIRITIKAIPSHHDKKRYLQKEAARSFLEMHAAAAKDGIELKVNSAFRSFSEQKRLYRKLGPELAAKPGFSNHQLGLAVDIADTERSCDKGKCPTIKYWWLRRNAHFYGFKQTLKHERWHWEWVDGSCNTD